LVKKQNLFVTYSFSEFVSTRIIHDLYQLCCGKRFRPDPVQIRPAPARTTLYKYLVIPKEGQQPPPPPPPPPPQTSQPKTPTVETRPTTNPFAQQPLPEPPLNYQQPPVIKRRISHNVSPTEQQIRPRSNTQPFIEHTEPLQHISTMKSGNGTTTSRRNQLHPKYDEEVVEEEQQQ
jgi:hypothetical protein